MQPKPILFFAVVGLLVVYTIANYSGGVGAPIGSIAPDFELKDADGNLVKLSDYRGKLVFLNFWATWCEPCVWEMPLMMTLNDTLKDRGFEVLTVSVDTSWQPIRDFYDQYPGGEPGTVQGDGLPRDVPHRCRRPRPDPRDRSVTMG